MDKLLQITDRIATFNMDRDWDKFHNPKDLAISLSIEASELLECFQWKTEEEINSSLLDDSYFESIKEEVADIGNYLILLCAKLNINLFEVIENKCSKNELKYPIEKCKGKADKYTSYLTNTDSKL